MRRLLLLLLLLGAPAWAGPPLGDPAAPVDVGPPPSDGLLPPRVYAPGPTLSLEDCLDLAWTRHPSLRAAREGAVAAEAGIRIVDSAYLPTMSVQGDKIRGQDPLYNEELSVNLNVSQTVFDSGQRAARRDAARAAFRAAVRDFQTAWIAQVQAVRTAYVAVLEAEYDLGVQQDNVGRARLNVEVAERFYRGGLKSRIDVTQARVQLSQALTAQARSQQDLVGARVALAQAVGVPQAELATRELVDVLQDQTELPAREVAVRALQEHHPTLLGLLAQAESNRATAVATRRSIGPSVSTTASYGALGPIAFEAPAWQVEVSVQFPFFTPSAGPTADQSDAQARQLVEQRQANALQLVQQLDTAIADVEGSRAQMTSAAQAVREAVENADLAYRRYRAGLSDIVELINAREFLASTRQEYVEALAAMKTAEANFYQAMGVLPRPPAVPEDDPLLGTALDEEAAREAAQPPPRPAPRRQR